MGNKTKYLIIALLSVLVLTLGVGVSKWNIHLQNSYSNPSHFADSTISGKDKTAFNSILTQDLIVENTDENGTKTSKNLKTTDFVNDPLVYNSKEFTVKVADQATGGIAKWSDWANIGLGFNVTYVKTAKFDETGTVVTEINQTPTETAPKDAGTYTAIITAVTNDNYGTQTDALKNSVDTADALKNSVTKAINNLNVYNNTYANQSDGNLANQSDDKCAAMVSFTINPFEAVATYKPEYKQGTEPATVSTYNFDGNMPAATLSASSLGVATMGFGQVTTLAETQSNGKWTTENDGYHYVTYINGYKVSITADFETVIPVADKDNVKILIDEKTIAHTANTNGVNDSSTPYKAEASIWDIEKNTVDTNYTLTNPTFKYFITRQEVQAPTPTLDYTYNGQSQELKTTGLSNEIMKFVNITYSGRDGTTYPATENAPTNAGSYTATFTLDDNYQWIGVDNSTVKQTNYKVITIDWEIKQKEIKYTWETTTFTYDGTKQTPAVNETINGVTVNNKIETVAVTRTYSGTLANGTTYSSTTAPKDAGEYTVTVSISNDNYLLTGETSKEFTIKQASLTVTAKDETITYGDQAPTYTVTYDGFVNNEDHTVLNGTLAFACDYPTTTFAAGNYDIIPSGQTSNNYDIKYQKGTLTVNKKDISYTWGTETTFTYDGQAHSPAQQTAIEGVKKLDGTKEQVTVTLTYTKDGTTLSGAPTNAGNYTVTASITNANYKLVDTTSKTFTISPKNLTLDWTNLTGLIYNGSAQEPKATATIDGGLVNGDSVNVTLSYTQNGTSVTAPTNAGTYTVTASISNSPANNNYKLTNATSQFTISPKSLTLDWTNLTGLVYNGSAQQPTATPNTADIVNNDTVTITLTYAGTDGTTYNSTTAPTNAGTYTVTASISNSPAKDNYTLTNAEETFTIDQATLTISWGTTNFTYTGLEQTPAPASPINGVNNEQVAVTFSYAQGSTTLTNAPTNAGTYKVTASVSNANYANNYSLTNASKEFTVGKAALTVTADNKTVQATKPAPAYTATYIGFVNNETVANLAGTLTFACGYKSSDTNPAQTYEITPSGLSSDNYTITYVKGTLTVTQQISIPVPVAATNWTYDGKEHALITNNISEMLEKLETGDTLTVTLNGTAVTYTDAASLTNALTKKDAATYTLTFTLPTDGKYTWSDGTTEVIEHTITVSKATATINWKDETYTYNGNPQSPVPTSVSGVNGETVAVTYSYTQGSPALTTAPTNAGTYTVTANISDTTANNNYTLSSNSKQFTIARKNLTIRINTTTNSIVYGQPVSAFGITLVPTGLAPTDTLDGKYVLTFNNTDSTLTDVKNAGKYAINIKITDTTFASNYSTTIYTATDKVVAKLQVMLSGVIEKQYGDTVTLNKDLIGDNFVTVNAPSGYNFDFKSQVASFTYSAITAKNYLTNDTPNDNLGLIRYTKDQQVKKGSTYLITVTTTGNSNITVSSASALFLKYKTAKVGGVYYTIEDAIAQNGEIIIASDYTGGATYVITAFSNVDYEGYNSNLVYNCTQKLILPYSADTTSFTLSEDAAPNTNIGSVLIIQKGITLNMSAELLVCGFIRDTGTVNCRAVLMNQGTINMNSGNLKAYGYIKGSGTINLASDTLVIDIFKMYDWLGGRNSIGLITDAKGVFPLQSYSLHNISCTVVINSGATYQAQFYAVTSAATFNSVLNIVGKSSETSAMFKLNSGRIIKSARPADSWTDGKKDYLNTITGSNQIQGQRDIIDVEGNCVDGQMTVNASGYKFSTSFDTPIPISFMDVTVSGKNSVLNLSNVSYKFLPGTSLNVESGATLNVASGATLWFYTLEQCIKNDAAVVYTHEGTVGTYGGIFATATGGRVQDRRDAYLRVNGTANFASGSYVAGKIDTTANGASLNIDGSTSATIKIVKTLTYDKGILGLKPSEATTTTSTSVAFGNIMTSNTSYARNDLAPGQYYSKTVNGTAVWYSEVANIGFVSNGGTAVSMITRQVSANGYTITAQDISASPTKSHYTFAGWYFDSNLTIQAQGRTIFASCNLYAKWIPVEYTITYEFYDQDGNKLNATVDNSKNPLTSNCEQSKILQPATCGNLVFYRWFSDAALTTPIDQISNLTKDITIYGQFYPAGTVFYVIDYQTNNETVDEPSLVNVQSGQAFTTINYDNYNNDKSYPYYFAGWYTDSTFNENSKFVDGTVITADLANAENKIYLYGKWVKKAAVTLSLPTLLTGLNDEYPIETNYYLYKDQKATIDDLSVYVSNSEYADSIKVPTGYKFAGFEVKSDSTLNCQATLSYIYLNSLGNVINNNNDVVDKIKSELKANSINDYLIGTADDVTIVLQPMIKKIIKVTFDVSTTIAHTHEHTWWNRHWSGTTNTKFDFSSYVSVSNNMYSTDNTEWKLGLPNDATNTIYMLAGEAVDVQINNVTVTTEIGTTWHNYKQGTYTFSIGKPPNNVAIMPTGNASAFSCDPNSVVIIGGGSGEGDANKNGTTKYSIVLNKTYNKSELTIKWENGVSATTKTSA